MKDLKDFVYNYKTKHKEGFTNQELKTILKKFKGISKQKFNNAMMGNTCMLIDEEVVNYHCDVLTALRCGIENRDIEWWEWD